MLKVKYHLWRGRVHCTMARDEEEHAVVPSNMSAGSLKKLRQNVFSHLSPGDTVEARVLKIRQMEITKYVQTVSRVLTHFKLMFLRWLFLNFIYFYFFV